MTVRVENWALCEDCGCPRPRMPDGVRCARCLGTNLRKLIALENDRANGGLMTLKDIARIIRPDFRGETTWLSNVRRSHKSEFPPPIVVVGNRGYYDFEEVRDWIYAYAGSEKRHPKSAKKLTLADFPAKPPVIRRKPPVEKLPSVEELCLDTRSGPC